MSIPTYSYSRIARLAILMLIGLVACSPSGAVETPTADSPCSRSQTPHTGTIPASRAPEGATIIENNGRVCFDPISPNNLRVQVNSSGCYSSSCSAVFERTGGIEVDQGGYEISLQSRFVVMRFQQFAATDEPCACTADCGGAGILKYETGELKEGIYFVRLGDTTIGRVSVPLQSDSVCLESGTTGAPVQTAYPPPPVTTPISPAPDLAYPPPGGNVQTPVYP